MPRGGARRRLVPIAARGASVWARGRLRALPEGHALGIPTRFWPTARSGIVGVRGALGLARDAVLPRPDVRGPIGDRAIGPLVARKLGQRVVDMLVDPLIGGIHAGSVDDMSAAATFPPLLAAAQRRGGLMRALRAEVPAPDPDGPPLFWALDGGMASLVDALAAGLRRRGVGHPALVPGRPSRAVVDRWLDRARPRAGPSRRTPWCSPTPAPATAALLRPHDDEVAGLLDAIDYASVVLVTFRVGADDIPSTLHGTGFLVPRRSPHKGREPWAVTACTYLDRKWPHLDRDGEVLLRASLGRIDDTRAAEWSDEEVAERAWEELGALMGVGGQPAERVVMRFATPSRSTGCTTSCARPASSRRWPASAASPWPARRTAASASPPASPAAGPRHTRSCEPPAAPGPRRRPLGRGGCPARALAPAVGLVAARARWAPRCSTGAWPVCRCGRRLWSGWLAGLGCYAIGLFWARAFNWYGAVVLILVEALFFAAAAGATPPRRGRALAFVGACTLAEAVRMTWPFGGLPAGRRVPGPGRRPAGRAGAPRRARC